MYPTDIAIIALVIALLGLAGCANSRGVIVFDAATCVVDPPSCN